MVKKNIKFLLVWGIILILTGLIQDHLTIDVKFFPGIKEIIPSYFLNFNKPDEKIKTVKKTNVKRKFLYSGEDNKYLERFYKKLDALEKGKVKNVKIFHFGDSIIWGDNFTYKLKRFFQRDFNDGGRGIVPVVTTPPSVLRDHISNCNNDSFNFHQVQYSFLKDKRQAYFPPKIKELGFLGESSIPKSQYSKIEYRLPKGFREWSKIELFLRAPFRFSGEKYFCKINLKHDSGNEIKGVFISHDENKIVRFDIPETKFVSITIKSDQKRYPFIDGVNLETGEGLVYNTIVRMGIHLAWLESIPDKIFHPVFNKIKPDLIIFQYGINESETLDKRKKYSYKLFKKQLNGFLTKLKKRMPGTDVLIIGTPERLRKKNGIIKPMPEILEIRKTQREICEKLGFAYLDFYELLGGKGHMKKLVDKKWALNDYTHISLKGGDQIAAQTYNVILNSYKSFIGNEKIKKIESLNLSNSNSSAIQFNSKSYAYFLLMVIFVSIAISKFPNMRVIFLILISYYFYTTWKVWPILLILASTVLDYFCSGMIGKKQKIGKKGTLFLIMSLFGNLGLLFFFKYFDFISKLISSFLSSGGEIVNLPLLEIVLPVGISFYTFQTLSYTIDVWRGVLTPEKNIGKFALFVTFFPQLVAGPIVRAKEFIPSLNNHNTHFKVTQEMFEMGIFLILTGLIKKMGADWLAANIIDRVYANPAMFSSLETLTAVYAYALQIYGDFSGYTDIALGSAMLLGYNLTENFKRPYKAISITDFWRRWHISLGSWFRDYLYISLGGNRNRVYVNLAITMFLCGLWHGAGINFVLWGMFHGLFLIVERLLEKNNIGRGKINKYIRVFITFNIVVFGWIIFRSNDMVTFNGIINSILKFNMGTDNLDIKIIFILIIAFMVHWSPDIWKERLKEAWQKESWINQAVIASVIIILLYHISVVNVKPFIYFQF